MNDAYRKICLINEVDTSIKLLKKGMGELQDISGANDFYHVPFLLLSSGYERLMKCLLCLAFMDKNGECKEPPFKKTHNLNYLLKQLLSLCEQKKYSIKFADAKKDIDMIRNDKRLRNIISNLSDFAQGSRYYNIDIVLKGWSKYKNPNSVWGNIELNILREKGVPLDKLHKEDLKNIYYEINHEIIVALEKFTRALARMFVLADLGEFAKQVSPCVYDYLTLRDDELGTRDYRSNAKRKKQTKYK